MHADCRALVNGTGDVIEDARFRIDDGEVTAVGPLEDVPADDERVDHSGEVVVPGFVDARPSKPSKPPPASRPAPSRATSATSSLAPTPTSSPWTPTPGTASTPSARSRRFTRAASGSPTVRVIYRSEPATTRMDRQKLFALFFALLMMTSMVAYAATFF